MNYFELFTIPFQFTVDLDKVNEVYRNLQRDVHPDKFANADAHTKLLAVQKSAEVNDGFETLKNPLSRAEYMLAEQGVDIQIEQKTLQDPAFLMQQMELREQLEELAQMEEPDDEIEAFEAELKQLTNSLYAELAPLLVTTCKITLENAANIVRKLKFMHKLGDELARIEDALL